MINLDQLVGEFETFWPANYSETWDRVGLSVGSINSPISKILISVDLTDDVIDEAIFLGAELILTHHPVLLKGVESVVENQLKGQMLIKLIRHNIAVFSAHTNADIQHDGASTLMAKAFGLAETSPLVPVTKELGHGVIGDLVKKVSLANFAANISAALPSTARKVVFSGSPDMLVRRVAICSGAGDSFLSTVISSDADVYVTSDLRHHPALDAISTPRPGGALALVDVSHWAAESLWVTAAVARIEQLSGVTAVASKTQTDPWTQEVD